MQLTVWTLIAMSRRVFSVIGPGATTNLGVLTGNYSTSHAQFLLVKGNKQILLEYCWLTRDCLG